MQLLQISLGAARAGEDDRERQITVGRVHQNTQQVEKLLRRTGTAREDDDAVTNPHKGLQALLDVGHDDQFVDNRVGRFGGDDAGLGDTQITPLKDALLGVGNGCPLHRALHHTRPAAGADVEIAQAQFVPDLLGVLVLLDADRVPTPAHHHLRFQPGAQGARVAQQMEDVVGDAGGAFQIYPRAAQFAFGINDVAQRAEQHLAGTGDHLAIDKGISRRVDQLQPHATILLVNLHFKIGVSLKNGLGVIDARAGVENRQRTLAEQLVQATGAYLTELLDFTLREGFQAAFGADRCIDYVGSCHARLPWQTPTTTPSGDDRYDRDGRKVAFILDPGSLPWQSPVGNMAPGRQVSDQLVANDSRLRPSAAASTGRPNR